jgi:oligopeptide transport system ATP-binding protein
MNTILEIKDIHVHFFTREGTIKVLNGVSLDAKKGEIIGILGQSGSGKTVLVNTIVNAVRQPGKIVSGEVNYFNESMLNKSEDDLRKIRGKDIAVIVSNPKSSLNPLVTVGEQMIHVVLAHRNCTKKEAHERVLAALDSVGINDSLRRMDSYPHELSGGMSKRVIIATALLHSPRLLIADEPTFGLDVTIQRQVLDMMEGLLQNEQMTTVIVTRDIGIAANYCHRVSVLHEGKIVEFKPVLEFFDNPEHPHSIRLLNAARFERSISYDDNYAN